MFFLDGGGEGGGIFYFVCYILRIIKVCDLVWYKRRGYSLFAFKVLVVRCFSGFGGIEFECVFLL